MFPSKFLCGITIGTVGLISVISRRKTKNRQISKKTKSELSIMDELNSTPKPSDSYFTTSRKRALQMIKHSVWGMKQDIDEQISCRTDLTPNQRKVLSIKWDQLQIRFNSLKVTLNINLAQNHDIGHDVIYEMLYNYFVFGIDAYNPMFVDTKIIPTPKRKKTKKNKNNKSTDDDEINLEFANSNKSENVEIDILLYIPLRNEYNKFIRKYCDNYCRLQIADGVEMRIDDSMNCMEYEMGKIGKRVINLLITGYVRISQMDEGNKLYGDIISLFMVYLWPRDREVTEPTLDEIDYQDPFIIKWEMYLNDFLLKVFENSEIGRILSKDIIPNNDEIVFGLEDEYD